MATSKLNLRFLSSPSHYSSVSPGHEGLNNFLKRKYFYFSQHFCRWITSSTSLSLQQQYKRKRLSSQQFNLNNSLMVVPYSFSEQQWTLLARNLHHQLHSPTRSISHTKVLFDHQSIRSRSSFGHLHLKLLNVNNINNYVTCTGRRFYCNNSVEDKHGKDKETKERNVERDKLLIENEATTQDHINIDIDQDNLDLDTTALIEKDPELKNILKELRKDFNENNNQDFAHQYNESDEIETPVMPVTVDKIKIVESKDILQDQKYPDYSYYQVAEDIEEYDYKDESEVHQQVQSEKILPISLERGKLGVFDLEELLIFMDYLGAENVVTVEVPPEANFCEHMVVASTKSMRHMKAIHDELLWVHKRKKSKEDEYLAISGVDDNFWSAMDLGNIVLHLFYGDAREFYDIESLWSLGPDADPKSQNQQSNKYDLSAEDYFWLEAEQLKKESTSESAQSLSESAGHPSNQAVQADSRSTDTKEEDLDMSSTKPPSK